jgi:hypothetical protein
MPGADDTSAVATEPKAKETISATAMLFHTLPNLCVKELRILVEDT